jgi:hypothetical protein
VVAVYKPTKTRTSLEFVQKNSIVLEQIVRPLRFIGQQSSDCYVGGSKDSISCSHFHSRPRDFTHLERSREARFFVEHNVQRMIHRPAVDLPLVNGSKGSVAK